MTVAAMNETLAPPTSLTVIKGMDGDIAADTPLRVLTLRQEVAASVARTAFMELAARMPPFYKDRLGEGNAAVRKEFGEDARELTLVGPDSIRFPGEAADVLDGPHLGAFLGILIKRRQLVTVQECLDSGFLEGVKPKEKVGALSAARTFFENIVDADGIDLMRTSGRKGPRQRFGIEDVVISDMRHGKMYQDARLIHSVELWTAHILTGDEGPVMAEEAVKRAALRVVSLIDRDTLDGEQLSRLEALGRKVGIVLITQRPIPGLDNAKDLRIACKGPQQALFYSPNTKELKYEREARESQAKELCAACPVRIPCLEKALADREPHGVWGGLTEQERKRVLARRS
jgi:hypothetical protein